MEFCPYILGPQWMNPNDFSYPLNFPLAPPASWHFGLEWIVFTTIGWSAVKFNIYFNSIQFKILLFVPQGGNSRQAAVQTEVHIENSFTHI